MRKQWLAMAFGVTLALGAVGGMGVLTQAGAQAKVAVDGGWRFSDGRWNYYDTDDRAWYYTDGSHWYSYGDDAWKGYSFDNNFGKAYVRERYVLPKAGPHLVVPSHKIKVKDNKIKVK